MGAVGLICVCFDVMGQCGGGGGGVGGRGGGGGVGGRGSVVSGVKGVTSDGRNLIKDPIGGANDGNNGGHRNNGNNGGNQAENFKKWALPAAVEIEALDTSKFDRVVDSLKLTEEQLAKIENAKKEIMDIRELLLKAQTIARETYERAQDGTSCQIAAGEVMKAANECQKTKLSHLFESKVSEILTAKQKVALR